MDRTTVLNAVQQSPVGFWFFSRPITITERCYANVVHVRVHHSEARGFDSNQQKKGGSDGLCG
jgi:hypothetical protein